MLSSGRGTQPIGGMSKSASGPIRRGGQSLDNFSQFEIAYQALCGVDITTAVASLSFAPHDALIRWLC